MIYVVILNRVVTGFNVYLNENTSVILLYSKRPFPSMIDIYPKTIHMRIYPSDNAYKL